MPDFAITQCEHRARRQAGGVTIAASSRDAQLDWWRSYFDRDYLVEHQPMLTTSRTRAEVARVLDIAGLPLGARVLDCPSGQARHARLFAEAGLDVTALDYSENLLDEARKAGVPDGLRLVRGDIRNLPSRWRGRFDAVVSLGASFGFFATPAEDEEALKCYSNVLRPGGSLVLHAANRDGIVARFIEKDWWEADDSTLVLHEREFDPLSGVLTVHTTLRRGVRERKRAYRIRLYTATDVAAMCARHNLMVVAAFDGWRDRPLRRTSGEFLLHCVRMP